MFIMLLSFLASYDVSGLHSPIWASPASNDAWEPITLLSIQHLAGNPSFHYTCSPFLIFFIICGLLITSQLENHPTAICPQILLLDTVLSSRCWTFQHRSMLVSSTGSCEYCQYQTTLESWSPCWTYGLQQGIQVSATLAHLSSSSSFVRNNLVCWKCWTPFPTRAPFNPNHSFYAIPNNISILQLTSYQTTRMAIINNILTL